MEYYYKIIKSWWEIFPDGKKHRLSCEIRFNRIMPFLRYETYEKAHKVAIIFRRIDSHYRYDLGDRIYVRRCHK